MILTGSEIKYAIEKGDIIIDPFDELMVNPNSYNYHLNHNLKVLQDPLVEPLENLRYRDIIIPENGIILEPARVYLGHTMEIIGSESYVPSLIGKSSLGRLGVFLQISADLGNLGVLHRWTLEIVVSQPTRVYPGMIVGQVSFWVPVGEKQLYNGFFGRFSDPKESNSSLLGLDRDKR